MGSRLLDELNAGQRQAVEAGDGPLLIVAGPGTGKTKTLTARIAYLITSGKAKPGQILALTFTNKAAAEMRQRVSALLDSRKILPVIATFHALCHELLGGEQTFVTEAQRLQIIKALPRPVAYKKLSAREVGLLLSRAKNTRSFDDSELTQLVQAYNQAMADRGVQDFDDLLLRAYDLLTDTSTVQQEIRGRFRYILVDEFQDTNTLQYGLLQLLRGHDNVCAIGDPRQSIYGFRGASGGIFEQFQSDFPTHQAITLTTNYRSVPEVVQLSNALFADAAKLVAYRPDPGVVRVVQVLNEYSEANWVVSEIQKAIGGGDFLQAVSDDQRQDHRRLSDFAVLYRSRSAASVVQKLLADSGLPFQIAGEGSPYDQPQLQAVIALLRAAATGETPEVEGFPSAQQRLLRDLVTDAQQAVPQALAEKLMNGLGFEITPDLQQLLSTLARFDDLAAALAYFDGIAEQAFYDPDADAITLLTIHASKGLEFPYVFLVGAEEGILPHERADPAEEKRLFYVAVTRAKERLDILHTKKRAGRPTKLTRFASEIHEDILPKTVDPHLSDDLRRAQKRQAKRSQQRLF